MGLQIATYKNRVKTLVPGYDLDAHTKPNPETITVTRNSVEDAHYASWSQSEEQEGMYIQAHSIEDGNLNGYEPNQLVAIVDLNYRYLSPINETVYGGTLPYQLGPGGCIEIDNLAKTIIKEQDPPQNYIFTLKPQQGFSIVPAGHVEVRIGDTWTAINGASWSDTEITPSLPGVTVTITPDKIVGNLRFVLNDCKYKVIAHKIVDDQDVATSIFTLSCNSTDSITINSIKSQFDSESLNYAGATKDRAGTTSANDAYLRDCGGDRDVYLNYTTKTYTITDYSQCANVSITPVLSSYPYDTLVSITITPETGKATVGPGSISMVGSPSYTWNTSQDSITRTFNITGDVTISTECGDSDKYTMMFIPKDQDTGLEIGNRTFTQVSYNQSFDPTEITPTVIRGYEYIGVDPNETIPAVTEDKTFTHYYKKFHTVTFVGTNGVVTNSSVTVRHGGNVITDNNIYSISEGYNSNVVNVGTLPSGVDSVNVDTDNKSITVTNVTEDVTINLSSEKLKFRVKFELEDGQSGTIKGYDDLGQPVENQSIINNIEYNGCMSVTLNLNSQYFYSGTNNPNVQQRGSVLELCEIKLDTTVTIRTSQVPPQYTVTYKIYKDSVVDETETETETVWPSTPVTKTINIDNISSYKFADNYIDSPYVGATALITSEGVSVSIPGVSQTGTVEIYLVTKTYEVKFEVYKDGTLDRSAGWTSNYTEGETFDDETFPYDDSAYEIDDVTSQELTVDYSYGDSGEIIISTETPITENATVEIHLTSIQQKEVDTVTFRASEMDAMGGVAFQAYVTYTEGDPETINNLDAFLVTYTGDDGNHSNESPDVVQVYDYNFGVGSTVNYPKVSDTDNVYQKCRLNLENTSTSSTPREVKVIWNGYSYKFNGSDAIIQRGEQYGYYTDIDSDDNTAALDAKLSSSSWKNSLYLVDYGDSCNMYGAQTQGLDIYNKDITPYYVTGTYIGENPLRKLDNKKTFVDGTPNDYNKLNVLGHNDHYHITWEGTDNKVSSSDKGKIFTNDSLTISDSFCGGTTDLGCGCVKTETSATNTLEAIRDRNNGVSSGMTYEYNCSYIIPKHNYGRDSISYYHEDSSYRSLVENSPFRESDGLTTLNFSYPVHIKIYEPTSSIYPIKNYNSINEFGPGCSSYMLSTVRWRRSSDWYDEYPTDLTQPNDSDYNIYYDNTPYYDYNNKIRLTYDQYTQDILFDKYNEDYYKNDSSVTNTDENNSNYIKVSGEMTNPDQYGRSIDLYSTLMSSETLIRPIVVENQTKFAVLSGVYNGCKYNTFVDNYEEVNITDYPNLNGILDRTRYVSEYYYDNNNKRREPLTTSDDSGRGIDLDKYPYEITGVNVDYLNTFVDVDEDLVSVNDYVELSGRDSKTTFKHFAYNLVASINYQQYYNKQSGEVNYYAHNSDDAKYIICTNELLKSYYYYFYDPTHGSSKTWSDLLSEGIVSITRDNYNNYIIVTNTNTYTGWSKTSTQYYYNLPLSLTTSDIYTDAHNVFVYFDNCDNSSNCGLGRIELTVKNSSSQVIDTIEKQIDLSDLSRPVITYPELNEDTNTDDIILELKVKTSKSDSALPYDTTQIFTGGGQLRIECNWRTYGSPGGAQTRTFVGNIGGSCERPDGENPNSSGAKLTWREMFDHYKKGNNPSDATDFDNTGGTLRLLKLSDNSIIDLYSL